MVLKSGELRHSISILQKTEINGTYGKETTWAAFKTVRAKVTQPRTDESDSDQGVTRKEKLIIFIRYTSGISENNRVNYNGNEYNVISARDVKGMRRELIIDAQKRS